MTESRDVGQRSIKLQVLRRPQSGIPARWAEYLVIADEHDRVLDLLNKAKAVDGSLTFRRSCGHGVCGSCAMHINGKNRLACQTLVKSVQGVVCVQPLPGLEVIKDLVVDMTPIFTAYNHVQPVMRRLEHSPDREQTQTPSDYARYVETTRCIMCAACTTACPVYRAEANDLGAAALVQAHRFIFDNRVNDNHKRLAAINNRNGLWRCRSAYSCTAACPQGIAVTQAIEELRHAAMRQACLDLRHRHTED